MLLLHSKEMVQVSFFSADQWPHESIVTLCSHLELLTLPTSILSPSTTLWLQFGHMHFHHPWRDGPMATIVLSPLIADCEVITQRGFVACQCRKWDVVVPKDITVVMRYCKDNFKFAKCKEQKRYCISRPVTRIFRKGVVLILLQLPTCNALFAKNTERTCLFFFRNFQRGYLSSVITWGLVAQRPLWYSGVQKYCPTTSFLPRYCIYSEPAICNHFPVLNRN